MVNNQQRTSAGQRMAYASLEDCLLDLEKHGQLVRIQAEIDADLELAEIQRRAYLKKTPAILFERIKGSPFRAACNIFGTIERARFIFRQQLDHVRKMVELKVDPQGGLKNPLRYWNVPLLALKMLPMRVRTGPVLRHQTSIDKLVLQKSWPMDGGPFVTLPLVYTEDVREPGWSKSNLGMYRVQLAGNQYKLNHEVGIHYQIHRGIGVHHSAAIAKGEPLKVSIHVGGPPALTVSAVMPLPEGMPELTFAGVLSGRRVRLATDDVGHRVMTDADFVICGTIDPNRQLPEGPFGDHLGYYSLAHYFPVMRVDRVYHRPNAIWPITAVGRPPQEDTTFGDLIHELTGPVIPSVLPGVKGVHAVDAAGVHPLLLALGSERYVPYASERTPMELLTQANAILGQGQLSLAKVLMIAASDDDPSLDLHDIPAFFSHVLSRIDLSRDLHFQTRTTIDTLDYSGSGLNAGSKLVIACAGKPKRQLATQLPDLPTLPAGFADLKLFAPGIAVVKATPIVSDQSSTNVPTINSVRRAEPSSREVVICRLTDWIETLIRDRSWPSGIALLVVVDDADFTSASWHNFLWTVFTRIDPASDTYGVSAATNSKHWECAEPLIFDARLKPWHAPPLVEDPSVMKRVDELCAKGGPLHGIL